MAGSLPSGRPVVNPAACPSRPSLGKTCPGREEGGAKRARIVDVHASSDDRRILRASDAERDAAIARLRHHGSVGRLGVDELTDRIDKALEAKTLGQLDDLFVDLPDDRISLASMPPPAPPVPFNPWRSATLWRHAAQLLVLNLVMIGLWASAGGHAAFWPAWFILISIATMARRASRAARRAERDARRDARRRNPPPYLDH